VHHLDLFLDGLFAVFGVLHRLAVKVQVFWIGGLLVACLLYHILQLLIYTEHMQATPEEFIQTIKAHTRAWGEWIHDIPHRRPSQASAILTMGRALYTCINGEQVSKKQAALWAQKELPDWSQLIQHVLMWREDGRNGQVDLEASFAETKRFVNFVRE
jgi:Domain of unknown function (DUF4111)